MNHEIEKLNINSQAPLSRGELWREARPLIPRAEEIETMPETEFAFYNEGELLTEAVLSVVDEVSFRRVKDQEQKKQQVVQELLAKNPHALCLLSFCRMFSEAGAALRQNYLSLEPTPENIVSAYLHQAEADFALEIAKTTKNLLRRQAVAIRDSRPLSFNFEEKWQRVIDHKFEKAAKVLKEQSGFVQLFNEIASPAEFFQKLSQKDFEEEKQFLSAQERSQAIDFAISLSQAGLKEEENQRIDDYFAEITASKAQLTAQVESNGLKTFDQKVRALRERLLAAFNRKQVENTALGLLNSASLALLLQASQAERAAPAWQIPTLEEPNPGFTQVDSRPTVNVLPTVDISPQAPKVAKIDKKESQPRSGRIPGLASIRQAIQSIITPAPKPVKPEIQTRPTVKENQAWYFRGFDRSTMPTEKNPEANKVSWQLSIERNGETKTYEQAVYIHLESGQNHVDRDQLGRNDVIYWSSGKGEVLALNEQGESLYSNNIYEVLRSLVEGDRVWVPDISRVNKVIELINSGQIRISLKEKAADGTIVVRNLSHLARIEAKLSNELDARKGDLKELFPDNSLKVRLRIDSRSCGSLVKGEEGFLDPLEPFKRIGLDVGQYMKRHSDWQVSLKNSENEAIRQAFAEYEARLENNKSKIMIIAAWEIVEVKNPLRQEQKLEAESAIIKGENIFESTTWRLQQERRQREAANHRFQTLRQQAKFARR